VSYKNKEENKRWYKKGLKDGIPIGMGYFAVAFTLGITAKNIGMTPLQSGLTSALMHASAGQFAAMTVIAAGSGYVEMMITTIIVNLRYLLMSCSLSQKAGSEMGIGHRLLVSYFVTDEIFGISSGVEGKLNPFYNYGAASVASPGWVIGSFLGASVGAILPANVANAMNLALYGMFMAIVIPPAKKNKVIAIVVVSSMIASYIFSLLPGLREISSGFKIMILTIVIAAIAAWKCPICKEGEAA